MNGNVASTDAGCGWQPIEHVSIGGVWIAAISRQGLVSAACADAEVPREHRRPRLIFDANGHGLSFAAIDEKFRNLLDQADVVHADGGFLVTASRYLAAKPVPERTATTDMIHDFATAGLSYYLLGGTEQVNAEAAAILQRTYPGLKIVGRRNGYFKREEEPALLEEINRAEPDVLWVGLGKPLEQQFCVRNRDRLNAAWIITCGGCYNYITGEYSRAPQWMQDNNLEWVHRAATKPRQLLWRYLTTTPHALFLTLMKTSRESKIRG